MRFSHYTDSRQDPAIVTPWSIVHFVAGMCLFSISAFILVRMRKRKVSDEEGNSEDRKALHSAMALTFLIHGVYEIKDTLTPSNSVANSIGDQAIAMFGALTVWYLCRRDMSVVVENSLLVTLTYIVVFGNFLDRHNISYNRLE